MDQTLRKLLDMKTNASVESFLSSLNIADSSKMPNGEDYVWKLVGGDLSNASHIQLAKSSVSPIVERIINGYDAHIELKEVEEYGLDGVRTNLPSSPRAAVAKWFNIPNGDLATYAYNLDNKDKNKFADEFIKLTFADSSDRTRPTLVIRDRGIGQHPSEFASTLLQLGNSNKMGDPCQHGNYGHGGASTYWYCTYSIIISRKAPTALNGKEDLVGWTIIRKNNQMEVWDDKNNKVRFIKAPPVYQYLSLRSGSVPTLSVSKEDFPFGTHVAHIEYDARHWQNISFEAWRALRNSLFDPVLPYKIVDERPQSSTKAERIRNMFGARSALIKSKDVAYDNEVEEQLEGGSTLKIRYWVLYDESDKESRPLKNYLERDNSRDTIILTLNGQKHSSFEKSIIARDLRMPRLSEYLLVQIITDNLTREKKGELFTADRESHGASDTMELIQKKLVDALADDDTLREWEKQFGKVNVESGESLKEVKKILDQLLEVGLLAEFGGGNKAKVPGVGSSEKYKPQDPPTEFDFLTKKELEITQGTSKTLTLALNGPDNLFTRRKNRGYVEITSPKGLNAYVQTSDFANGRLPLVIEAEKTAQIDTSYKLRLLFKSANLKAPLELGKQLTMLPAPEFLPVEPPTKFGILRKDPILMCPGEKKIIQVEFDGADDVLTRPKDQAQLTFYCSSNDVSLIRRRGPKRGRIQLTVQVSDSIAVGNKFKIGCKLSLANGSVLDDAKNCVIIAQPTGEVNEREKGALIEASKPNYKFIPVYRDGWSQFSWGEEDSAKYDVTKDDDGRDLLELIVNMDNKDLETERQRRISEGSTSASLTLLENKYAAYVCYHLYQQYKNQSLQTNKESPQTNKEEAANGDKKEENTSTIDDEQKGLEMQRVSKTLLYALSKIKNIEVEYT